jgi:SAM-dependent methyltransferase
MKSKHERTIDSFGEEWLRFDQSHLTDKELNTIYDSYFSILPPNVINSESDVADVGAGSGRFAEINAPRCKRLVAFEPSKAAELCRKRLSRFRNCTVVKARIKDITADYESSFDLVYCLGVLHHTNSIRNSLAKISQLVRPSGCILLYIYYNFDNKPFLFKAIWSISNLIRIVVSRLPNSLKFIVADIFAVLVYLPLSTFSSLAEKLGFDVSSIPLSAYRKYSFETMRTDSLDRFGTRVEHRMSKAQLKDELEILRFKDITFSEKIPYWTVCAIKE